MNFSISKNVLFNALSITAHAVSSTSPQPVLRGIRIDARDNSLTLTGSGSDISIQKVLKADEENKLNIVEEGSILIESRYLLEIVKRIDSEIITIEIVDGSLTRFSGGTAEFRWNGMKVNDYPAVDFGTPMSQIRTTAGVLREIIDQTAFAASDKETRPVLTGVNFRLKDKKLICTATDSYRLSKKTLEMDFDEDFSITIPAHSLNEVKSTMLEDASAEITIAESNSKVQFISKDMILQSRLLDGGYPDTDRLIPSEFSYTLKMDRNEMIHALERNLFIKNDNMSVDRLQASESEILLTNEKMETGASRELLNGTFTGGDLDISFSGVYMLDAVRSLTGDEITVCFTAPMKPFIVKNEKDETLLQLVLPVRTYH